MVFFEETVVKQYESAWLAWQTQLSRLHDVFLKGEEISPDRLKGLLNREARTKHTYEIARRSLLGISADPIPPSTDDGKNPFKQ
jgi:hypothetical protein